MRLYYGQDLAKHMPQCMSYGPVTLVRASPIGNAYLGSGRRPRPGSPRISRLWNFHRGDRQEFPGIPTPINSLEIAQLRQAYLTSQMAAECVQTNAGDRAPSLRARGFRVDSVKFHFSFTNAGTSARCRCKFSADWGAGLLRLRPTWGSISTEEAATDATDAALMTSIAEMGRGAAAEAAIDAGVTSAAAEAAGDDAAPERVLAAPSPGDFLASAVLSCLLYDGALVKKEHVRAAKSLAATSKAWAAVDDAVRATLRKEVEAGGWGPFLVSVESTSSNARFRVSFWNAEHQDLGAFAVHDPC